MCGPIFPSHSITEDWDCVTPFWGQVLAANLQLEIHLQDIALCTGFPLAEDPRLLSGDDPSVPSFWRDIADDDALLEAACGIDPCDRFFRPFTVSCGQPVTVADVDGSLVSQAQVASQPLLSRLKLNRQARNFSSALHAQRHPVQLRCTLWPDPSTRLFNAFARLRDLSRCLCHPHCNHLASYKAGTCRALAGPPASQHDPSLSQRVRPVASTANAQHLVAPSSDQAQVQTGPKSRHPSAITGRPRPVTKPSDIAYMRAARIGIMPEGFDFTQLTWPGESLQTAWQAQADAAGDRRFTVFEAGGRPRTRRCEADWLLDDMLADAVASSMHVIRTAQFIERPMFGLPTPQIVLTHASAPDTALAVPFDYRRTHGWVITLHLLPAATLADLPELGPPGTPRPTELPAEAGPLTALADSAGQRHVTITQPLARYEWLAPVFGAGDAPTEHAAGDVPEDVPRFWQGQLQFRDTSTTTTSTTIDPELRSRPVSRPMHMVNTALLPSAVGEAPGAHIPIPRLGLFPALKYEANGRLPYHMLVRGAAPMRMIATTSWTLLDVCSLAADHVEGGARSIQVITCPIPGLLQPQVVVTDQAVDADHHLLPVDLRAAPCGDVVPVPFRAGITASEIVQAIVDELPDSREFLERTHQSEGLYFQDCNMVL